MELIDYLMAQKGENFAVIEKERNWTYKEFVSHVLFVRNYLYKNEISGIMICLPQCFYAYSIIWGAYLAGVPFCPVTPSIPLERKNYFISSFKPDLIITNESDFHTKNILTISPEIFFKEPTPQNAHLKFISPESLAYVIFTSGSTGFPKGVMLTRKGLENLLKWGKMEYKVTNQDRWGQHSNLGFDLSIFDIFFAIICGAALVPISTDGEKLMPAKVIHNKAISFLHSVPSVVDLMNKANDIKSSTLSSLKTIIFCGERLFPAQLELLFNIKPDLEIYNTYGPTEITIFCTCVRLTKDNYKQFCDNTVSIGNTIPGYEIKLDKIENGLGEIVVIGDVIAKGYISSNESEANSKYPFVIIDDNDKKQRAYHTGDYAEMLNNNMYFVGRKDSQIKVKGQRVDLSEIDFHLREYGCNANITAYHNNKIISFVVDDSFSEQAIRTYLEKKIPSYYMPNAIIKKEIFPYNSSGKIDVKELLRTLKF